MSFPLLNLKIDLGMFYQKLNSKKCKGLQQTIFDYLHSDNNKRQNRSCFDRSISSLEEQTLFPTTQPQKVLAAPKIKRQKQIQARIGFKSIIFNDISISKHSISLSIPKKKQPDMEISFTHEGKKCKLSISPLKNNAIITVTLSSSLMQIEAKNAFFLEFGGQSQKPKWVLRFTHVNCTIRANYHAKKYDQDAIEMFFIYNNINFVITDPAPTKKLANSQVNCSKEMGIIAFEQTDKTEFPLLEFMLPIDPFIDRPINLLLSHLNNNSHQNTENLQLQSNIHQEVMKQSKNSSRMHNQQNHFDNRQQTKPERIQDNSLTCQKVQQIKTQNQQQFQENYEQNGNLECNFRVPTEESLVETYSDKLDIINLELKEKQSIITDIFQIKKFKRSDYSAEGKKIPCPISSCGIIATEVNELREHLYSKHKELSKHGIKVNAEGKLKYSQKSVNYVLYLASLYPNQIKKVIKKMKLKVMI